MNINRHYPELAIDLTKYQQKKKQPTKPSSGFMDVLNRDISFSSSKLNDKKKERFYSELEVLFNAGLDIKSVFEILTREQQNKKQKALYEGITNDIIKGESLANALKATGQFSNYEYYSIRIGEESGKITVVLKELADFFNRKVKLKQQFVSVFTYPLFILGVTFGVVYFMLTYIVPMFEDVFKRFDGELPPITQYIIGASEFLQANVQYILFGFITLIGIVYSQRKQRWFRKNFSNLVLRLPLFGELIRKVYLARLCQSMHLLISSKTPLTQALELVQKMIGFFPLEEALEDARKQITRGSTLYQSFSKHSVFPSRMLALLNVGEEVNRLGEMFDKMQSNYSDEVEHQTKVLGSIMEPIMIIFIAGFVGLILVSMYLPLFNLSSTIG